MTSEWHIPDAAVSVRQGDLLICRNPHERRFREICLVITADCDISKGKFGRQLACLRVMLLHDYLRTIWAARKLQQAKAKEAHQIWSMIVKWHSRYIGADSSLTMEAASDWVKRVAPDVICRELRVPEEHVNKMEASLTAFRSALFAVSQPDNDEFSQLVAFLSAIQGKDCSQEVAKRVQNEAKSGLPIDVFLLPTLPQYDTGPVVVLLREIVAVPHEAVCYRACDAISEQQFLRLGRLEPTFKYAVSQAFGALYSRIGLPDDYDQRCSEVLEQITTLVTESPCVP